METIWRIELLGGLRAVCGDRVISRFSREKERALLAYLAYNADRAHPREQLMELLWPERYPAWGRGELNRHLSLLRAKLEPAGIPRGSVIMADRQSVQFSPQVCTTDVAGFTVALEAAARAARPAERQPQFVAAVELYRGELLPGFSDTWVLQERQWLAEQYFGASSQLLGLLEAAGEFDRALAYARQGVRLDPEREEAHRDLIRLLAAAGQRDAALKQYAELARMLRDTQGEEPEPETRVLIERIRSRSGREVAPVVLSPGSTPGLAPPPSLTGKADLPAPVSRFFGRSQEIALLLALLRGERDGPRPPRLVTLTGPAGSGKTRLTQVVARRLRDRSQRAVAGVSLADLAPAGRAGEDPSATCRRIAEKLLAALGLPHSPDGDPQEQAIAALSRQPILLLLDNLEHLLPPAASLVRMLLERVEHLTVLATSRRRLGLAGEYLLMVPPLPVPVAAAGSDPESETSPVPELRQLLANPCVRLFLDRAQAALSLTRENAADVAELCRRLEGLPLAIELAAASTATLTPRQMLAKLADTAEGGGRFELLDCSDPSDDPKQRGLRAALDWSYELLPPDRQRFFTRLAVFRGGWTLEAADAVGAEGRALPYLRQLQECSLVLAEGAGAEKRFRLLETLREYGEEKLAAAGALTAARDRHLQYFCQWVAATEPGLPGPESAEAQDRLEQELDNLRAALDWAATVGAAPGSGERLEAGLRLAGRLCYFWTSRGYLREGRERLAGLLESVTGDGGQATVDRRETLHQDGTVGPGHRSPAAFTEGHARALYAAAWLAYRQADLGPAAQAYQQCRAIYLRLGMKREAAFAVRDLAAANRCLGNDEAEVALLEEHLSLRRDVGDRAKIAEALLYLGIITSGYDRARSRALLEESRAIREALEDKPGMATALRYLGNWCHEEADAAEDAAARRRHLAEAGRCYEESLALCRESGNRVGIAYSLLHQGRFADHQGDLGQAQSCFAELLALWRQMGDRPGTARALLLLGRLAREQGDHPCAVELLAAARSLHRKIGYKAGEACSVFALARIDLGEGKPDQARSRFMAAVRLRRPMEEKRFLARQVEATASQHLVAPLENEAARAAWQQARRVGDLFGDSSDAPLPGPHMPRERAVLLFGAAAALRESAEDGAGPPAPRALRPPVEQANYDCHLSSLRNTLGEEAFGAVWEQGRALTLDQILWHLMWEERW